MIELTVISVRLDADLEERLAFLMDKRKIVDKSAYIRQLLYRSVGEDLIDYLCDEVKEKRISSWKAAEMAEISLRAMLSHLASRNIALFDDTALEDDLAFALRD